MTDEQQHTGVTLGIEMSNPTSDARDAEPAHAIALWAQDKTLIGSIAMPKGTRGSDGVIAAVDALCAQHDVRPTDLACIIVSIGPGGYTALRIATTTAKMLAFSLGAQLIAVPTARVAACAVDADSFPAIVGLASKKQHTHATRVHADGTYESIGIIEAQQLEALGVRALVADDHLPQPLRDHAQQLGLSVLPIVLDARNLLEASTGIDPIQPELLAPMYAREPDAVTQWRARSSG